MTSSALNPRDVPSMMTFCVPRFSAVGPPLIRRSSSAGSLRIRSRVVRVAAATKNREIEPSLPEATGSCGDKQQKSHYEGEEGDASQALASRVFIRLDRKSVGTVHTSEISEPIRVKYGCRGSIVTPPFAMGPS